MMTSFSRDPEIEKARPPKPTVDTGPGRTKQSMRDDSDINLIMSKYKKTGVINFVNSQQATYDDMENIDFHQAMTIIADANAMFAEMPAHLRKEFKNDPGVFLEFVHNPDNAQKMYELGLSKTAPPAPSEAAETPAESAPEGATDSNPS